MPIFVLVAAMAAGSGHVLAQDVRSNLQGRQGTESLEHKRGEPRFLLPKQSTRKTVEASPKSESYCLGKQSIKFIGPGNDTLAIPGFSASQLLTDYFDRTGSDEDRDAADRSRKCARPDSHPFSIKDIYDFGNYVEKKIRDAGYVFAQVFVAPQEISLDKAGESYTGDIRYSIIPGFLARIKVCDEESKGCRTLADGAGGSGLGGPIDRVAHILGPLLRQADDEHRPVNIDEIEDALLRAEEIPGVDVTPTLSASRDQVGAIDMEVRVKVDHWSGELIADNRGSDYSGPWQSQITTRSSSFTDLGEQVEAVVFYAWPNRQRYGQLSVGSYIGGHTVRWRLTGSYGDSLPGGVLQSLGYRSESLSGGLQFDIPIIRKRNHILLLQPEIQAVRSVTDVDDPLNPGNHTRQSESLLRVARVQATYKGRWFSGSGYLDDVRILPLADVYLTAGAHRGLPVFGATTSGSVLSPRPDADGQFTKYTAAGEVRSDCLPFLCDWRLGGAFTFAGQISAEPLLPTEKFYAGGMQRGRGYYYGQITGDSGYFLGGELYIQRSLVFSDVIPGDIWRVGVQLYGFYNFAKTFDLGDYDIPKRQIESTGVGVRLQITDRLDLEGEIARRLELRPLGEEQRPLTPWAGFARLVMRW